WLSTSTTKYPAYALVQDGGHDLPERPAPSPGGQGPSSWAAPPARGGTAAGRGHGDRAGRRGSRPRSAQAPKPGRAATSAFSSKRWTGRSVPAWRLSRFGSMPFTVPRGSGASAMDPGRDAQLISQ